MAAFNIRSLVQKLAQLLRQRPVACCALIVVALYWPTLQSGYLMDDFIHQQIFEAPAETTPKDHLGILTLFDFASGNASAAMPWWATQGIETRFWRPLSSLIGYVDHIIAPKQPVWAHIHSVLWFIASIASLRFLLRESCDQGKSPISWVALLALLIYTMTCTHAFPTLWIANRGALIASTFAWLSIGLYARSQRKASTLGKAGSALALTAALLAGEIGWVGVIQLGCFALWGDERPWKQKLAQLWPHALIVVAWTLVYVQHGYGAHGGGDYLHPIADLELFLKEAPLRLASLSALALAFAPMELTQSQTAQKGVAIAGGLLLGLSLWCARAVIPACSPNHQRSLRWMGYAGILGTLPILGAQPNDRLLVPIMLSSSFFFATMIRFLARRRQHRGLMLLAGLGATRHLMLAPCLTLLVNWSLSQKSQAGHQVNAAFAAQLDDKAQDGLHFILNSPGPEIAWTFDEHLSFLRGHSGTTKGWRFAASTRSTLRLSRSSSSSFELATQGEQSLANGFFGKLLRSHLDQRRDPLAIGQVIDREDFTVTIVRLNAQGQPTQVRFNFPDATQLQKARIYHWDGQSIRQIELPKLGKSIDAPWHIGPMEI